MVKQRRPIWLYSGPFDPDRLSPDELSESDVWDWLMMVLKGAEKEPIGDFAPFDSEHLPNLLCIFSFLSNGL